VRLLLADFNTVLTLESPAEMRGFFFILWKKRDLYRIGITSVFLPTLPKIELTIGKSYFGRFIGVDC
jgi:hypothetical protein